MIDFEFGDKHDAARIVGYHPDHLNRIRRRGEWVEGIHFVTVNSRCIRYNLTLIKDWLLNKSYPDQHQKTVEAYVRQISRGYS